MHHSKLTLGAPYITGQSLPESGSERAAADLFAYSNSRLVRAHQLFSPASPARERDVALISLTIPYTPSGERFITRLMRAELLGARLRTKSFLSKNTEHTHTRIRNAAADVVSSRHNANKQMRMCFIIIIIIMTIWGANQKVPIGSTMFFTFA